MLSSFSSTGSPICMSWVCFSHFYTIVALACASIFSCVLGVSSLQPNFEFIFTTISYKLLFSTFEIRVRVFFLFFVHQAVRSASVLNVMSPCSRSRASSIDTGRNESNRRQLDGRLYSIGVVQSQSLVHSSG